jgi:hypothetical protein
MTDASEFDSEFDAGETELGACPNGAAIYMLAASG